MFRCPSVSTVAERCPQTLLPTRPPRPSFIQDPRSSAAFPSPPTLATGNTSAVATAAAIAARPLLNVQLEQQRLHRRIGPRQLRRRLCGGDRRCRWRSLAARRVQPPPQLRGEGSVAGSLRHVDGRVPALRAHNRVRLRVSGMGSIMGWPLALGRGDGQAC